MTTWMYGKRQKPRAASVADEPMPREVATIEVEDRGQCVYCGDPADTTDHVLPRSATASGCGGRTVPACRDCNCAILRDEALYSVEERGRRVASALRMRLISAGPAKWTAKEARESLSGFLLRSVLCDVAARKRLERRAGYAESQFIGADP